MSRPTSSPDHDHEPSHRQPGVGGSTAVAPGKQTLTQAIPSLRGQERDVVRFDAGGEYREDRATIDGPPPGQLDERALRKARRRNPPWQRRLGFAPAVFGGGDVGSDEFAANVAARQAQLGVAVDGIAGPKTVAAIGAGPASGGRTDDAPADVAGGGAAVDDPFGMHLLG